MDSTAPAITIAKLTKQYRGSTGKALKNVSLEVGRGEVYGFLGPNGAGKSTTIRCLLNFIQPTSGSAAILGNDSVRDSVKAKRHIGYLAGDVALYRSLTGQQFLDYMTALQPLKRPGYVRSLTRAFRAELHRPIEQLSKGNRQKIGIIQACMHEPEVLILDEPTSGLDPLMQEVFYHVIRECKARGTSVFISSHNLNEVRRMCDRVGFIRSGTLVAEQNLAALAAVAAHTFELTFAGPAPLDAFKRLKHATVKTGPDPQHITVRMQGDLSPFFGLLSRHKVSQIDQREVNLEEEFMQLYEKGDA